MSGLLFAYGTLRDDSAPLAVLRGFEKLPGVHFPTIAPAPGMLVEGRVVSVDDWAAKDRYESRVPGRPEVSLYWRLPVDDEHQVYVGNPVFAESVWGEAWGRDYTRCEVAEALEAAELEVSG